MKIVSVNIYGLPIITRFVNERVIKTIEYLIQMNPDIIAIQEANTNSIARKIKEKLESAGYIVITSQKKKVFLNDTGLIIAVKNSEYVLNEIQVKTFDKQFAPFTMQMEDGLLGKSFMNVVLKSKSTNSLLSLYNVHTVCVDYMPNDLNQKQVLGLQLKELNQCIQNDPCENKIVTGDFNADIIYVSKFLNLSNFNDPLSKSNPKTIDPGNTNRKLLPTKYYRDMSCRYDFTFFSGKFNDINQKIGLNEKVEINEEMMNYSDHYGIISTFTL